MSLLPQFISPLSTPREFQYTMHGEVLQDDWQWLEDAKSAEQQEWSRTQQEATRSVFEQLQSAYPLFCAEIRTAQQMERESAPHYEGGRPFYSKQFPGSAQRVLCTRVNEKEIVLFDPVQRCDDDSASIHSYDLSPDSALCSVGIQRRGAENLDVYIIDSAIGEEKYPCLESIRDFSWGRESAWCFYKPTSEELLSQQAAWQIRRHFFGTDRSHDKVVHSSPSPTSYIFVHESQHSALSLYGTTLGNGMQFRLTGRTSDEAVHADANSTSTDPDLLYEDEQITAIAFPHGEWVYWFSHHGGGRGQLLRSSAISPQYAQASPLIPEHEHTISSIDINDKYIVLSRRDGLRWYLAVYSTDGLMLREVDLPDAGSVQRIQCDHADGCWYVVSVSFIRAQTLYRFDPLNATFEHLWTDSVQLPMDDFETRLEFCESADGTRVPLSITCRRDIKLDGTNPALMKGYGGFGIGVQPAYDPNAVSFLRRGGILVNAGIRGGDEYGETWHRAAMLDNKQNCFDDFIAAAEYLISSGYCSRERLCIQGGSNGGLLVGAVSCQRPELFASVVCDVPLLDMVRYVHFSIARLWIPEYGDPAIESHYRTLRSYSPYHQLNGSLCLPTMLVCVAENDTRTDPLHGRKFVAAAQTRVEQTNPVMLWVDKLSGHQGGSPTQHRIQEMLVRWLFILASLNIPDLNESIA